MVYVVSNFKGYLHVDNAGMEHWIRNPFSADKFEDRKTAERNAALVNGIVVEI